MLMDGGSRMSIPASDSRRQSIGRDACILFQDTYKEEEIHTWDSPCHADGGSRLRIPASDSRFNKKSTDLKNCRTLDIQGSSRNWLQRISEFYLKCLLCKSFHTTPQVPPELECKFDCKSTFIMNWA
ncbi:uncharacterized protein LOC125031954 isoform X2 [Penaeus chinensis]|uniref:uncharacterized protein LOC125031954 isoform X2 n=1 Tax=Penaeus chinensis TaxID=139456 RepID=UPI001FB5C267|nr:uncharacterized protein LOC125031954 isoform X2 [Penaeus chinensis]